MLDKIRTVEVAGISPFKNLISKISVPEIPELMRGGILKKGQVGLLEGKGDERILPLEEETGWIKKIASQLAKQLSGDVSSIKGNTASLLNGGAGALAGGHAGGRVVNIDARQTLQYNGNMSLKEVKQREREHYVSVKTKLKAEGFV